LPADEDLSMEDVVIRPVSEHDAEGIARLDQLLTKVWRIEHWEERIAFAMRRDPEGSLVAEKEGRIVAYLFSDVRGSEYGFADKTGWLEALGVDPDMQKSSLGRRLMDQAMQRFHATGVKLVRTLVSDQHAQMERSWKRWAFKQSPSACLPKKYHDAVLKWQKSNLPDLEYLQTNWSKYFPKDPTFKLCAYRDDCICAKIEHGTEAGQEKYQRACEMSTEQANHLLKAVKAQASTEFGSIQQHRLTLARAQEEQDQFWVLRMMAEELRHGYQMLSILLNDDWKSVVGQTGEDMVEEILSMKSGTHVLGAFNIDFDSFVDNIVFCNLIDRVGKYQLTMQKVSAYRPMAESMGPMLREEAFHLAAGVIPMRRWMQEAARGEVQVTVDAMQRAINKWLPRGLEMFGDERGGASNIKMGFKDSGERSRDIQPDEILRLPAKGYFRRRGVHAYEMIGSDGRVFKDVLEYIGHLRDTLPEAYLASNDFRHYLELLKQVAAGTTTRDEAQKSSPQLSRVGGSCPAPNPSAGSCRRRQPAQNRRTNASQRGQGLQSGGRRP
jgi:1,2-phenylacetyl-CoA epoxidase catalytic subunit/predicted N-acetyltransferase YhbS